MPLFDGANIARYAASLNAGPAAVTDPSPKRGIGAGPYAALAAGNAFDVLSSLYGEHHGTHEANPLIGDGATSLIVSKLASTLLQEYLVKQIADSGHPTAAKVLGYGLGAVPAVMGAHNLAIAK